MRTQTAWRCKKREDAGGVEMQMAGRCERREDERKARGDAGQRVGSRHR